MYIFKPAPPILGIQFVSAGAAFAECRVFAETRFPHGMHQIVTSVLKDKGYTLVATDPSKSFSIELEHLIEKHDLVVEFSSGGTFRSDTIRLYEWHSIDGGILLKRFEGKVRYEYAGPGMSRAAVDELPTCDQLNLSPHQPSNLIRKYFEKYD